MEFDFIVIAPLLSSHCGFFFDFISGYRASFLIGSRGFFVVVVADDCSAVMVSPLHTNEFCSESVFISPTKLT